MTDELVIRPAHAADAASLSRLGALDAATSFGQRLATLARSSQRSAVLVADAEGELLAALEVRSGHVVADPFQSSEGAKQLLAVRYEQLRSAGAAAPRLGLRRLVAGRLLRTG